MSMTYKTQEEAIEAAKLSIESGVEPEPAEKPNHSHLLRGSDCWCQPQVHVLPGASGLIIVHRRPS